MSNDIMRWTTDKATEWQRGQPWYCGCNFIPSTAVNQLEMWQEDSFDPATIDRELGWARGIGMNCARVYLHDLAYEQAPQGFLERMDRYLEIADAHGVRTLFVLFDDCWLPEPHIGRQPEPRPGVHNSGWVNSPGVSAVKAVSTGDRATEQRLERYVKAIVSRYASDARVLGWDLYNEPGNGAVPQQHACESHRLLELAFRWARAIGPSQPLTSGVWSEVEPVRTTQLTQSDVITFHVYQPPDVTAAFVQTLQREADRPLFLCTEFMSRGCRSTFQNCLPIFKGAGIGALCWGLVAGKTNTIFPWGSKEGASEPSPWFHDVLHPDGTPYDDCEVRFLKEITCRTSGPRTNSASQESSNA